MNIKQLDALSAYSQASKQLQNGIGAREGQDGVSSGGSAFSGLIDDALGDVKAATANTEVTAAKALVDEADMVDVATAVSNAELVVETVVTVRDKVISAYNDIIKMPI
ncbi:flagellar hook-basal body complex protein FliE [Kordiimonas laminariae]|uniref:flagellar hook-basal body complex protein FliE n=1 Tax=Kordiimonas laminariae TaxID=2917717 RepID=UPI001FF68726|nr:flagellar hook-basal body complex protein FliE [Kordiimonas laminariae]MCK0069797.1 flagellar hook-basal body complex protein FliE [Kordiimonas laminariae]